MFDLNINHYNEKELEELLGFENDNYTLEELNDKYIKILSNVNQKQSINYEVKEKTINFLTIVKEQLINKKGIITDLYEENNHFLITNKTNTNQNVLDHFENDIINPIKKQITYKYLNIDSRFRDNYSTTTASNFSVSLDVKLNECLELSLKSIEPPSEFNTISSLLNNNYFTVDIDGTKTVIEVDDGNYTNNISGLLSNINSKLNTLDCCMNYVDANSKITFKCNATPTNINLDFDINKNGYTDNVDLEKKLGYILGFTDGSYNTNAANSYEIVSTRKPNVNTLRYCYLVLDDFQNNVNPNLIIDQNKNITQSSIISRISLLNYERTVDYLVNPSRIYFGPTDLQKFKIQLVDDYGRIMDTANFDFSFMIEVKINYNV